MGVRVTAIVERRSRNSGAIGPREPKDTGAIASDTSVQGEELPSYVQPSGRVARPVASELGLNLI